MDEAVRGGLLCAGISVIEMPELVLRSNNGNTKGHLWFDIEQSCDTVHAQLIMPQWKGPWETFWMTSTGIAWHFCTRDMGWVSVFKEIDQGISSEPEAWLRQIGYPEREREKEWKTEALRGWALTATVYLQKDVAVSSQSSIRTPFPNSWWTIYRARRCV